MADLPKQLKIGAARYEVVSDRKAIECVEMGTAGVTALEHQRITIDPERGPDAVARTVLHEVLHSVWFNTGRRSSEKVDEETAIRTLSPGLLAAFRENPGLVRYLMEE